MNNHKKTKNIFNFLIITFIFVLVFILAIESIDNIAYTSKDDTNKQNILSISHKFFDKKHNSYLFVKEEQVQDVNGNPVISVLKSDLAHLQNKSNNILCFRRCKYLDDVIVVECKKNNTSILNVKATGRNDSTLEAILSSNFQLKPNTQYTVSANYVSGTLGTDIRPISFVIRRHDNASAIASFDVSQIIWKNEKPTVTFTTPDIENYDLVLVFASGSVTWDTDINFNIVESSVADYSEYLSVDINKDLPTIQKLLSMELYDVIVAKDGSGDYTTVTEAVANCEDFSTIYVKNGVYDNEIIKAWLKTVFIIGESREGVIIKNNTGNYATPPIEMGTGLLKNLTVYAEKNDQSPTPSKEGYALHSESSVESSKCNFFALENCTFKSDWRQSWGMGMRGNTNYYARNCYFESVYFHDCEHIYRATVQNIEFDNCNLIGKGNREGLLLQDQNMSGAEVNIMFNRCLVKSENAVDILYAKWNGKGVDFVTSLVDMPNWHLSTFSYGNSNEDLNAK